MRPFSKQTLGRSLCQGVNAGLWCPGSEQRSEQRPAVGQWASGPDSCYPIPWGLVYFGAVRTDRDLWTVCWFMLFFFLVWICLEYMKCHFGIGCVFSKCSLQIQFFFLKEHVDHVARACVCWPWRPSEGNYLALIIECVWMCCPLIYAWSWRWYSH